MPMEALERDMDNTGRLSDTVDRAAFCSGMSRLGSAVSVVTTRHGTERCGFTASAV
jgi:flavin reductase